MAGYLGQSQPVAAGGNSVETEDIQDGAVTDAKLSSTKLDGIETGATADQTAAEIKTAYESNSDTNTYTDSEKTKLAGVATAANNYSHPATHPASMLTGALPAIDGSALTGIETVVKSATAPSSPAAGDQWYDTTTNKMKVFNGTAWDTLSNPKPYNVEYLIVAGGGGGGTSTHGSGGGGGGGAGGLLQGTYNITVSTQYSFVVGAGGNAGGAGSGQTGSNGSNSTGFSLTAIGGGGGGSNSGSGHGNNGGSGGGGGYQGYSTANNYGSGTSGQGHRGGGVAATSASGGGGGGAGGVGQPNYGTGGGTGGAGGSPVSNSISGTATNYARGGKGGQGTAAVEYGSGGGGTYAASTQTHAGNQGIVVLRMLSSDYTGITTGSPSVTIDGNYTVLSFTSSGSYTT